MQTITANELNTILAKRDASTLLIDVREPFEFDEGHISGARNIPVGALQGAVEELKTFKTVYVQCLSGGRSSRVCQALAPLQINAVNVDGGIGAWERAGLPVVRGRA